MTRRQSPNHRFDYRKYSPIDLKARYTLLVFAREAFPPKVINKVTGEQVTGSLKDLVFSSILFSPSVCSEKWPSSRQCKHTMLVCVGLFLVDEYLSTIPPSLKLNHRLMKTKRGFSH
jgi:hypothetical protein